MVLIIYIFDFGDIEFEVSFLVLGYDCGWVCCVLIYGFLIFGG